MKTTTIVVIASLITGGCGPRSTLEVAAATRPAALQPAASITIEVELAQRWPTWIPVTLAIDTPPGPDAAPKLACVTPVPASRLAEARRSMAEVQQRRERERRARREPPMPPAFRALDNDFDDIVWLVVTQTASVKPRENHMFNVAYSGDTIQIMSGQRSVLGGRIPSFAYRPGTIEVYALWTERSVEVARSAVVRIDVADGTVARSPTQPADN